jgi:hypothetical protein
MQANAVAHAIHHIFVVADAIADAIPHTIPHTFFANNHNTETDAYTIAAESGAIIDCFYHTDTCTDARASDHTPSSRCQFVAHTSAYAGGAYAGAYASAYALPNTDIHSFHNSATDILIDDTSDQHIDDTSDNDHLGQCNHRIDVIIIIIITIIIIVIFYFVFVNRNVNAELARHNRSNRVPHDDVGHNRSVYEWPNGST